MNFWDAFLLSTTRGKDDDEFQKLSIGSGNGIE